MSHETATTVSTTVSTASLALGKPLTSKIIDTQKEKRSHSEVADSSLGDEFTSIQKQLDQLTSDIQQTREDVKSIMKKEEMKSFITDTVTAMFSKVQKKLEKRVEETIEEKLEEKLNDKLTELNDRLDSLVHENVQLREANDKLKGRIDRSEKVAMEKSNMNEQYSRKNNIKIMGVEGDDETEEELTEKVNNILRAKTGVTIIVNKIMAIHRIPGKSGMPKPVLIKLMNNNEKTKIMKKRKLMKQAGYRLVDDVTKQNTKLISRLNLHTDIDSAWYFNGNVFAKTTGGKRFKFDLFSVVEDVINKTDGATSMVEDISDDAPLPAEEVMDFVIRNF